MTIFNNIAALGNTAKHRAVTGYHTIMNRPDLRNAIVARVATLAFCTAVFAAAVGTGGLGVVAYAAVVGTAAFGHYCMYVGRGYEDVAAHARSMLRPAPQVEN